MLALCGTVLLFLLVSVIADTDYRQCDVACLGVYTSDCDLGETGLSGCVTCSKAFQKLDKSTCRACLVGLNNATIIQDFDYLVSSCRSLLPSPGLSTGAKVGIAVGVILVVIGAVVGTYIFIRQRKAKKLDPRYSYDPAREPVSGRLAQKDDLPEEVIPVNTPIRYPEDDDELPSGRTQNYS